LSSLKKVKHILLDGTGSTSDDGSADSCTPSPSVTSSSEERKDYVQHPGPITDGGLDSKSRSVPNINFDQSPLTDEYDPSYAWFSSETSALSERPIDEKQETALRNSELSEPSNTMDTDPCNDESKAHEESPDKIDADLSIFADYDSIQSFIEEGEKCEESEGSGSQRNESLSFEAPRILPETPLLGSSLITKPPFKPDAEILSGVSSSYVVLEKDDDKLTREKRSISTTSLGSFSAGLQNSLYRPPGVSADSIKLTPVTDSADGYMPTSRPTSDLDLSLPDIRRSASPTMPLGNDGVEDNHDKECSLQSPPIVTINSPQLPMIQGLGITQLDSPRHVSYARSNCGNPDGRAIDVYDWDRIIFSGTEMRNRSTSRLKSCSVIPYPTVRDGRIYSSGSYSSIKDLEPLTEDFFDQLIYRGLVTRHLATPSRFGQDGAGEIKDKIMDGLRGVKQARFATEEHKDKHKADHKDDKKPDEVALKVENNTLFLCFPEGYSKDPIVAEISLKVRPFLLGPDKSFFTFVFSGLPYCTKPAFFDFKVSTGGEEWSFDAGNHEQTGLFETIKVNEINRLNGRLHLTDDTPTERSIIMRIQKVPSHVELHDYKIQTRTIAVFSNTPDGVVGDFTLKVHFTEIESDATVAHNLVNLILVNGTDNVENISVTTGSSDQQEKFSIEGPVLKEGEELKDAVLLQVSRRPEDVTRDLKINFRKTQDNSGRFYVPLTELGSNANLLEQAFVVDDTAFEGMDVAPPQIIASNDWEIREVDGAKTTHRKAGLSKVHYPYVIIHEPVYPLLYTDATMVLEEYSDFTYIEKIKYEFEEHSSTVWESSDPRPLHIIQKFTIQGPLANDKKELLRINGGDFELEFATINGVPVKGLFMDHEELVIMSNGEDYSDKDALTFRIYWKDIKADYVEFKLPRIINTIIGRVVCKFQKDNVYITSRRVSGSSWWQVPFKNATATLSGLQSFRNDLYLGIALFPTIKQTREWDQRSRQIRSLEASLNNPSTENMTFEHPICETTSSLDGNQDFVSGARNYNNSAADTISIDEKFSVMASILDSSFDLVSVAPNRPPTAIPALIDEAVNDSGEADTNRLPKRPDSSCTPALSIRPDVVVSGDSNSSPISLDGALDDLGAGNGAIIGDWCRLMGAGPIEGNADFILTNSRGGMASLDTSQEDHPRVVRIQSRIARSFLFSVVFVVAVCIGCAYLLFPVQAGLVWQSSTRTLNSQNYRNWENLLLAAYADNTVTSFPILQMEDDGDYPWYTNGGAYQEEQELPKEEWEENMEGRIIIRTSFWDNYFFRFLGGFFERLKLKRRWR
jgi:hypothetical protein